MILDIKIKISVMSKMNNKLYCASSGIQRARPADDPCIMISVVIATQTRVWRPPSQMVGL